MPDLVGHPTQKARDVLPQLREINQEWNAILAADLTEEELEQFRSMLARIAERATGYADESDFE